MRQDHVIAIAIAGALGLGVSIAGAHQVHYRQTQKAAQVSEAVQRAETAVVAREEARALTTAIAQRDQAQAQAQAAEVALQERTAERDQKQAQIDKLQGQVAALSASSAMTGLGGGTIPTAAATGNHFPYGFCTWYVASRRYVPWNGNAIAWLAGAQAFGYPTGVAPRPGAIMVTAESGYGHVAYVESVGSSSFTVSEMNYVSWGVVDWRQVAMGSWFIRGFVY